MHTRIKALRNALGLNQTDFGAAVGVKQTTVAGYENGTRTPIDAVVSAICREFNVSETWLRTGDGPMFRPRSRNEELFEFLNTAVEEDGIKVRLLTVMARLSEDQWELLADMARKLAEEEKEKADPE